MEFVPDEKAWKKYLLELNFGFPQNIHVPVVNSWFKH